MKKNDGKIKLGFFNKVKGILFDYGGVIEDLERNPELYRRGVGEINNLLDEWNVTLDFDELFEILQEGQRRYEEWYQENNYQEPDIVTLWTDFLLLRIKDIISGIINTEKADNLSSIYEFYSYKRRVRENVRSVISKLYLAGYNLGIVSNTMSLSLIPERLKMFEVSRFFTTVTLSIECGYRKPNPAIFHIALKRMNLKPEQCVFIGDTMSRDIVGAKKAGIGKVFLLESKITDEKDSGFSVDVHPDNEIEDIADIFHLL